LHQAGFQVIRFSNAAVFAQPADVLSRIWLALHAEDPEISVQ